MELVVKGKQMDVGDALRGHIEKKLRAGVAKYFDSAIDAKVVVSLHRHGFRTDCSVHVGSGINVQGHGEADDAYASVDSATDRIEKRLRRFKRRLRDHRKTRSGKSVKAPLFVLAAEDENEEDSQESQESDAPTIVAEEATSIETLTVGEAVMRMTLADDPVLVFSSSAHGGLNVVFKRTDGNIGWIDPQPAGDKSSTDRA
jgi:ribosomal subunit interface protein